MCGWMRGREEEEEIMQERKMQGNLTSEGLGPLPRCLAFWQEGLEGLCKPLSQLTLPEGHPGVCALTENIPGDAGQSQPRILAALKKLFCHCMREVVKLVSFNCKHIFLLSLRFYEKHSKGI